MKTTLALTTWTEHPALINEQRPVTLHEYAQYLPAVEVDTFFYALPQLKTVQQWVNEVSAGFQFIVKAHQSMTKHPHAVVPDDVSLPEMFERFRQVVRPLLATNQLKTVLFQFPPQFDATVKNIEYLMKVRQWMGQLPVAVELRNQSWYRPAVVKSLVDYCRELNFTLVAADEPHQIEASIPFYLVTTNRRLVLLRLHGRNNQGWNHPGPEWRKRRTLYRYSDQELRNLSQLIYGLQPEPQEVCVIFNNNSGRDAAPNAQALQKMMGLHFSGLVPRDPQQLDLF
ncbi:DUF72 domain-containing protein [uncultured Limosilactobacillus sp.]|uniref:DUF72 domain-containing protein n=1 Tax=uncultured Limosilactobacillus sp. TaxID=2837629 RepID=UPI0025E306E9|nr:DUF72 domain-containing protein [uncultured Limosilactobacillus sp.]